MARTSIPYLDRKDAIRSELVRLAQGGKTIFYGELGAVVSIPARGPWKPVLDEIGREETARGLPDITFLVINKQTGLPGQIAFKPAKPPTADQRKIADEMLAAVFGHYRGR